jgi:hypothetical protein
MFISPEQVKRSLGALSGIHPFFGISYLAFKRAGLPVGSATALNFSQIAEEELIAHYQPFEGYGFYQPFKTAKVKRWISARYGSTSLQRITKDTFADALIHPTQSEWGWREKYVSALQRHLRGSKIPAFDLAVWLFRDQDVPVGSKPQDVSHLLFEEYEIGRDERRKLFDESVDALASPWLRLQPLGEHELFAIIGFPPNYSPAEGVTLALLELTNVGPAKCFRYEPNERLNILTGDNFLGKTFILDCTWRALTGHWLLHAVEPTEFVHGESSEISYQVALGDYRPAKVITEFDWERPRWIVRNAEEIVHSGVVTYARHDGSFALWDPTRLDSDDRGARKRSDDFLFLSRDEVWEGLKRTGGARRARQLCNGLLSDWIRWQTSARYKKHLETLKDCLKELSPPDMEPLGLGTPKRLPPDTRDFPTVRLPYGDVPVILVAAGVQRAVTLAYMLVWSWYEHLENCKAKGNRPQRRMVVIIDEIEAHLHPRWQRGIVPALMAVIRRLSDEVRPQLHIATHSPLVMASAEPIFDPSQDALHHLKLAKREVRLEQLTFEKRGTVDSWLMSDVFGLAYARSIPAEKAIEAAKALQMKGRPKKSEISSVHRDLARYLAPDDEFWPRWRHFAVEHGVDE